MAEIDVWKGRCRTLETKLAEAMALVEAGAVNGSNGGEISHEAHEKAEITEEKPTATS